MHPSNKVTLENAGDVVRYRKPDGDQVKRHEMLAQGAEAFIKIILCTAPDCADRSSAVRHARLAKMEASAAIALEESGLSIKDVQAHVDMMATPLHGVGPSFSTSESK